MDHQEYFKNLERIRIDWAELRKNGFPPKLKDEFWNLCMKGRELFAIMVTHDKLNGFNTVPKTVPSYEFAILLLEQEKKYEMAILLCEDANKWEIRTYWYSKKIDKFRQKIHT